MPQTKIVMLPPEPKFPAGGSIGQSSGMAEMPGSVSQWFLSLRKRLFQRPPRHLSLRASEPLTDRDEAISLAKLVLQKQKLGISLIPSQAVLLSREFLLAVKQDGIRAGN